MTVSGDRGTDEVPDLFSLTFVYNDGTGLFEPAEAYGDLRGISVQANDDGSATVSGVAAGDTISVPEKGLAGITETIGGVAPFLSLATTIILAARR